MQVEPAARLTLWQRLAVKYFLAQALAVVLAWAYVLFRPQAGRLFWPFEDPPLLAFMPPDFLLLVVASLGAALAIERRVRAGEFLAVLAAGASAYAGIYTITVALFTGRAWLAADLMAVPAVVPAYLAWRLWR